MAYEIRCDHLLLLTLGLQIFGIFIPFLIVLQRNIFDPPFPFISQTIGFSPENGIFAFFLIPGSFFGSISSILIHILPQGEEDKSITFARTSSLSFSILYFLSWLLIISSPVTFIDLPNKYEWVTTVLSMHMTGALLMLSSCIFFVISQALLNWNINNPNVYQIFRRKAFFVIVPTAGVGILALLALGFEELSIEGQSMSNIDYVLPTRLSYRYVTTSLCEWTLTLIMWLSLGTFYEDFSRTKLRILVKANT